jgi:uracil-DNA glycosylase
MDDEHGRPFIGSEGPTLRKIFKILGLTDYYMTNLVACRSCEHLTDEQGLPKFRAQRRGGPPLPVLRDCQPTPIQWKACLPRLQEEIYMVDPLVIVAIGGTVAEALTGKHITIGRDHGQTFTISIPGAGYDAVLTEKKKEWYHKVRGEVVAPVVQSQVHYSMIPTLPMFMVLKKAMDMGTESPFKKLVNDIRKAVRIYEMYLQEVFHQAPSGNSDVTWEEVQEKYGQEETT